MTYYEKLVRNVNRSMKKHPRSAVALDMDTLQVVATGGNLAALNKKMAGKLTDHTLIFQKPDQKSAWIL